MQAVGTQFGPSAQVLGLPLGSPYTAVLSATVLDLQLQGVIDSLARTWKTKLNQCGTPPKIPAYYKLGISNFKGLWYIQVAFLAIAIILVIVENVKVKIAHALGITAPAGESMTESKGSQVDLSTKGSLDADEL